MSTRIVTRAIAIAIAAAPAAIAIAQPTSGGGGGIDVDPSAPPSVSPPGNPNPAPNVIVVGPDGKPVGGGPSSGGGGGFYYDDGAQTYDEPQTIRIGPTPELHVVRSGDTLWDICWYYFNDPWQWPKVWSYNAQITNPHWIYPGDLVRLIPRGMFVSNGDPDPGIDTGPDTRPDVRPSPQRRVGVGLKQVAFVEQKQLDRTMKIEGSVEEKQLLSIGDAVYVSYPADKPPQVGKKYSIYKADNPVKKGKKQVGAFVRILGQLEIVAVKKTKFARALITDSNTEIERGDLVGPLIREFKNVPPQAADRDLQGSIVAMLTRDQLIGDGEIVFLDLGKKSGVKIGHRLYVVRRGDAHVDTAKTPVGQNDDRFPARALGEVVVVDVGEDISIGLVTLSVQEMGIGDLVLMQEAK
jgi:hypothetical protein